jgi:hypothetical protein
MLIKDLIKQLESYEAPEMPVLVSRDEEGNGYHDIGEIACDNSHITIYPNNSTEYDMDEDGNWHEV